MRVRLTVVGVLLLAFVSVVAVAGLHAQAQSVSGYLVDLKCATTRANDAGFPADHTKECMLMEACVKSGYGVMTADKKLIKFDAAGNAKANALLKATNRDKDWRVTVKGTMKDGVLSVESIAVQ
jgi:hypothetical protein